MRTRKNNWTQAAAGAFLVLIPAFVLIACAQQDPEKTADVRLTDELIGTWFAYRDNMIENMWTFRRDGTVSNDGWPDVAAKDGRIVPPYHVEGTYRVYPEHIEVYLDLNEQLSDTLILRNPKITHNRLVYDVAAFPVVFLRERAAVGQGYLGQGDRPRRDRALSAADLAGSWVAFAGGFPANVWSFNEDGSFLNEGWAPLDPRTIIVRRLYQIEGAYEVSGDRVILRNKQVRRFDPQTSEVADAQRLEDQEIVLYSVVVDGGRLIYTNDSGLPVAYRRGSVSPTNW